MILFLLFAVLFADFGQASNVIPHIPYTDPPKLRAPLTLRDPIHPGTVVWISGLFKDKVYSQDLKIYVIAGGNGEYNAQMKAAVLEIRAYHDQDKITYGSLSEWGGKWNYGAESKNPVRGGVHVNAPYEFVLEFKDKVIVVWVDDRVLSVYPYSPTIHDPSEISGIHITPNDELEIMVATHVSQASYGSCPYSASFDPPLSKEKQHFILFGVIHCSEYANNDVEIIFHNSTADLNKNYHFCVAYTCKEESFAIAALIDGKIVGIQEKNYPASELKTGIVLYLEVDAAHVKVTVNGDDLMDYSHQVDIVQYPITNLDINVADRHQRFSLSLLAMPDYPDGFERKIVE